MKNFQLWFGSPLGLPINNKFKRSDDWLSSLVAGAAATTNAIIGGAASMYGANSAVADSWQARVYDAQKMNVARNWQLEDRDFALKNQREQMDWQVAQRKAEQAFIAAQNNPRNQVAKLLAAGINPAAVFGQAGSGGQIGSAPSTPGAPGLPNVPQQVGTSSSGLTFSRSQAIASLGDTIAKLTNAATSAGKNFPEVRQAIAETNKAIAETSKEQEETNWIRVQSTISQVKLPHEINKLIEDARELSLRGDYHESVIKLNQSIQDLNEYDLDMKKETRATVVATLQAALATEQERAKTEQARQKELASQGFANFALGRYNNELAVTERQLRDGKVTLQQLTNEITRYTKVRSKEDLVDYYTTREDRIHVIMEQARQAGLITDQIYAQAKKAISDGNWAEVHNFLGALGAAASVYGNVAGGTSSMINALSSKERNEVQREFNRIFDEVHKNKPTVPLDTKTYSPFTPAWQMVNP